MSDSRINEKSLKKFYKSADLFNSSRMARLILNPFKQLYSTFFLVNSKEIKEVIADTFWGEKMKVLFPGFYSNIIYKYGFVEEYLITFMLKYLKPNDTFIDIGAHYGFFTLLASEIVGSEGKVYSFEPTPLTYKVLRGNIKDKENVTACNCLLWSSVKELVFRDYGLGNSEVNSVYDPRRTAAGKDRVHYTELKMQANTLDNYVKQNNIKPDFIKIDAESAEMEILYGMQETIDRHKPHLTLEIGDYNLENVPKSRSLIEFLTSKGYKPYEYFDKSIREHKIKDNYDYQVLLFINQ